MSNITSYQNIPLEWENPPVYARYSVQLGKMLNEKRITGAHLAPYLRNVDVQWNSINTLDLPEMDFSEEDRELYALQNGDLLVCEGGEVGRTAVWNGDLFECFFQKAIHRLRPITQKDEPRFFRYFMRMAVDRGDFTLSSASTIQHLTAEKLRVVRYPAPPRETQRAIADYLDRETARLDALVAAKERVLDLLAEKHQSLITRAVTRGLDTSAPLRDSGIPWLGEIPAHWEIWKIGHTASVGNGSTPSRSNPAYWSDGTIPWLNSSVVNQYEVTSADQFVTGTAVRECHLPLVKSGSVLVAITGQGKTRGQAVVLSLDATINQHLAYVSPDPSRLDPWFLRWTLLSAYGFLRSISDDAGGTKGALTCEEVANIHVPIPPIGEQRAIAVSVAMGTATLEKLRTAIERTSALLKERRTTLIAAAVTGLINIESAA